MKPISRYATLDEFQSQKLLIDSEEGMLYFSLVLQLIVYAVASKVDRSGMQHVKYSSVNDYWATVRHLDLISNNLT